MSMTNEIIQAFVLNLRSLANLIEYQMDPMQEILVRGDGCAYYTNPITIAKYKQRVWNDFMRFKYRDLTTISAYLTRKKLNEIIRECQQEQKLEAQRYQAQRNYDSRCDSTAKKYAKKITMDLFNGMAKETTLCEEILKCAQLGNELEDSDYDPNLVWSKSGRRSLGGVELEMPKFEIREEKLEKAEKAEKTEVKGNNAIEVEIVDREDFNGKTAATELIKESQTKEIKSEEQEEQEKLNITSEAKATNETSTKKAQENKILIDELFATPPDSDDLNALETSELDTDSYNDSLESDNEENDSYDADGDVDDDYYEDDYDDESKSDVIERSYDAGANNSIINLQELVLWHH